MLLDSRSIDCNKPNTFVNINKLPKLRYQIHVVIHAMLILIYYYARCTISRIYILLYICIMIVSKNFILSQRGLIYVDKTLLCIKEIK